MANTGLLFVSNISRAHNVFLKASEYVKRVLYIKVRNPKETLSSYTKTIVNIYTKSTSLSDLDVRFILKPIDESRQIKTNNSVDVILYDKECDKDIDLLKKSILTLSADYKLQEIDIEDVEVEKGKEKSVKQYEYVALGGTFDRLHNGHKIFLSEAALRTTKELTVAVTDVNMIQSKKLWELIEPVEKRMEAVRNFLTEINPEIEYNVIPLTDFYGPTKDDPKLQMLVVSDETKRGGDKINDKRKENNMPPMDIYSIDVVEDDTSGDEEELKVSSSNRRMRLLGTILRPPVEHRNIPDWPYVIGLAGGIASGKTKIAERLKKKGAGLVNCDLLAHELYKPGLPLNTTIAEAFGDHIITDQGEVDRRKLGQIVFSDKSKLEKLNNIMWPAILEEAMNRVQALGTLGHRVVVLEAAVMIQAQWYNYTHQLWSVIVPPEEAVKRIQNRNGLSEQESRERIASQPSNLEQIAHANVIFSPYWSYEHTQGQVDKAWDNLQEYLKNRK